MIGACLRAVANLFPITAPEPENGHLVSRCVETSRVLVDLLRHYDLPAKPMPVDINICNPAWYRNLQAGVRNVEDMPEQAWSLGVNAEGRGPRSTEQRLLPGSRGWDGHLLVQSGRRWMMDANAGQFNRPGRIRLMNSWLWPYPKDLWQRDATAWEFFGMGTPETDPNHPEYALIFVRNRPDNIGYQHGTAWDPAQSKDFTEQVIELIDSLIAGTLPDYIKIDRPALNDEIAVDLTLIKQRWTEEAP